MTDEERSTLAREAARARWATERRGLEEEQQGHAGSRRPDDLGWLLRRRNVTECPPSLTCSRLFSESFPVAGKLKPAHRPQIVAMAFRTTSTAPRIVAITTTTAAARHRARMSFSMGVRSEPLARPLFQEQALTSEGRGTPEQSTTQDFGGVLHKDESVEQRLNVLVCPSPALAGSSNGNCRTTALKEAQAFRHDQANDEQRDQTRRHLLMRAHPRLCLTCCD